MDVAGDRFRGQQLSFQGVRSIPYFSVLPVYGDVLPDSGDPGQMLRGLSEYLQELKRKINHSGNNRKDEVPAVRLTLPGCHDT